MLLSNTTIKNNNNNEKKPGLKFNPAGLALIGFRTTRPDETGWFCMSSWHLRPGSDAAPLNYVPNLTDELSSAKERRLNQVGTAVLVRCGKSVKFDRVCRTFDELNLSSTHSAPSESDVAPVSLQSRTNSVRFRFST